MRLGDRKGLSAGLGLFLQACALACAPAAPSSPGPSAPVAPRAAPGPDPARQLEQEEDPQRALEAKLEAALAYVADLRGLAKKSAVKGRLITRKEIAAYVKQQIDAEAPKDVVEASEALLFGLGTVEASFDYRETLLELMSSQLLGFYDPKQKAFFVSGDLSGDEADATLWHELVHALQDQHYDLARLTDWQPDLGDTQAAIHALAEGDATSLMLDAVLKPRGGSALELPEGLFRAESVLGAAASSAPPVLVRSLLAPYLDGLAFTHFLRKRNGFQSVDAAWRNPPVSTEQVLHPEKYLSGEAPKVVPLPTPPAHASELKERYHDVMGEQTLRIIFEEWMPARTAAAAAADWGGDRLAVFSDEARSRWAFAWHVRYDTEVAAVRGLLAFARGAALPEPSASGRLGDYSSEAEAKKHLKGDKVCRQRHNRGPIAVIRQGKALAVTVGPFERNRVAPDKDASCAAAFRWAEAVLTP